MEIKLGVVRYSPVGGIHTGQKQPVAVSLCTSCPGWDCGRDVVFSLAISWRGRVLRRYYRQRV